MNKVIFTLLLSFSLCNNLGDQNKFNWDSYYKELINTHNKLRIKHGLPFLTQDKQLEKFAQDTANNSLISGTLKVGENFRDGKFYGQNLYLGTGNPHTGKYVAEYWYSEIDNYSFSTGKTINGGPIGHFTQMVWKSTKKLGCGVGQKTETSYKVVCHYLPKGNIYEKYDINVLPVQAVKEENKEDNTNNYFNGTYEEYITKGSFDLKKKFYLFELGFILCLLFI